MKPRVYLYKITFEGRPEWYWGVHKERKRHEYYMGSPKTHKYFWFIHKPVKEVLREFEYSEEGWKAALQEERSLIKPFLNDPLCLNEGCGGCLFSRLSTSNFMAEKWKDPEYRARMGSLISERNTVLWQDPAFRERRSEEAKLQWQDPFLMEQHLDRLNVFWSDSGNRRNQSQKMTEYWSNPDNRKAHSVKMKGVLKDNPETREKLSKSSKATWQNPEYRQKMKELRAGKGKLPDQTIKERIALIESSDINLQASGWVIKVSKLLDVSHAQVKRFFDSYWVGPSPYRRNSSQKV